MEFKGYARPDGSVKLEPSVKASRLLVQTTLHKESHIEPTEPFALLTNMVAAILCPRPGPW